MCLTLQSTWHHHWVPLTTLWCLCYHSLQIRKERHTRLYNSIRSHLFLGFLQMRHLMVETKWLSLPINPRSNSWGPCCQHSLSWDHQAFSNTCQSRGLLSNQVIELPSVMFKSRYKIRFLMGIELKNTQFGGRWTSLQGRVRWSVLYSV